jgi:P-type conjugative transfer protein TrbJ
MNTTRHPFRPLRRPERPQNARKRFGRFLLPLTAAVLLGAITAPGASAQIGPIGPGPIGPIGPGPIGPPMPTGPMEVFDPGHIAETIINGAKIVDQIQNQVQQIRNEVEMLRKLPSPPWRTIRAKMQELDAVMRAGESLAYSMDGLLNEFGVTFPGFRAYTDWSTERRRQFDRTLGTLANTMMSLQTQGRHFATSQGDLDRIKNQLGSTSGQTGAIELGNTIGAFTAEELVLIRQLLATQANAQAVQAAYQINEEAQRLAYQEHVYREMADYDHPTGRGYSGILSDDNR